MIKYYLLEDGLIFPVKNPKNIARDITWCDVKLDLDDVETNKEQIAFISYNFQVFLEDLNDMLDINERPRYNFDLVRKNQFFLLRSIRRDEFQQSKIFNIPVTLPVGLILTPSGKIITIHYQESMEFEKILELLGKYRYTEPIFLFLELIQVIFMRLDKASYKLANEINEIQRKIIESPRDTRRLNTPFLLNSYLIFFNAAIHGNHSALSAFMARNESLFSSTPELYEKVDDIKQDIEQVVQFSTIYIEQVKNLLEQVYSISNNSLNQILKVVGSISLLVSVPTIIAAFYGMNVALPGGYPAGPADQQWVFILIVALSFSISFVFWLVFRKLKWL